MAIIKVKYANGTIKEFPTIDEWAAWAETPEGVEASKVVSPRRELVPSIARRKSHVEPVDEPTADLPKALAKGLKRLGKRAK